MQFCRIQVFILILATAVLTNSCVTNGSSQSYSGGSSDLYFAKYRHSGSRDKFGMFDYPKAQKHRVVRTTAYSDKENEPGAYGKLTSSGTTLIYGRQLRTAAADWSRYPLGTEFRIEGYPYKYIVEDYGRALVGTNTIDLYKPNLWLMKQWGTRHVKITVTKWGDPEKSMKLLKHRAKNYKYCRDMYNGLLARTYL